MSTAQAAPVIPPRPSRSPRPHAIALPASDMPKIPPRPVNRRMERSMSPTRDSYAPSPLNEPPGGVSMTRTVSNEPPRRPPSVTIPSLGEEGIEYEDLPVETLSSDKQPHLVPAETRNVSSDLKLHAPKPSLPSASAKARVQAVTRTDSHQAAVAGFGKASSPSHDDVEQRSRSMYSKTNGSCGESSTASTERRHSLQFNDEHGIPEIGQRVPMYPNAGDVQAPSPAPFAAIHGPTSSAAGHRPGRNHHRTRSNREVSLPPGSYGLHGHGVPSNDKFEKAWYDKHPDEYVREEQGQYGPGISSRPDWALSSDDLNKIVKSSAARGVGLGTSPNVTGTPEEELGYIASEEYTSRLASPPPPTHTHHDSQPVVESPLRNVSSVEVERKESMQSTASSEAGDTGVIHVDNPYHQVHHPDGYAHTPEPATYTPLDKDLEQEDEPILAADEVEPESAFMHPAISPSFERSGSVDYDLERYRSRTPSAPSSRPASRPRSLHGAPPNLTRYNSRVEEHEETHIPLEDVEEYEPLFPEDSVKPENSISTVERLKKRPDLKHRFPSQDIWEDTPDSLQLHASVSTPEVLKEEPSRRGEVLEAEFEHRKQSGQVDSHMGAYIVESAGPPHDTHPRPDPMKQRFPSQDIWEDAPDSQQLVTTIEPHEEEVQTPTDASSKPTLPLHSDQAKAEASPTILPRPQKPIKPDFPIKDVPLEVTVAPTDSRRTSPTLDRPKPQIPTRPSKPVSRNSPENVAKGLPAGSASSSDTTKETSLPLSTKPRPIVPPRPAGGKIAGLKADFLSNLNSRLQQGPQGPKPAERPEETEAPVEKAPLSDARKERARGPVRRKPATVTDSKLPSIPEIRIMDAWNVWQVCQDGHLVVGEGARSRKLELPAEELTQAPVMAKDVTGETVDFTETEEPTACDDTGSAHMPRSSTTRFATKPASNDISSSPSGVTPAEMRSTAEVRAGPRVSPTVHPDDSVTILNAASSAETNGPTPLSEIIAEGDLKHTAAIAEESRELDEDINA